MRSWPDVSTGRRTRPSFWTSLQDAVDEIEGGEVSLPLAGIEGALGEYGLATGNVYADVSSVADDNIPAINEAIEAVYAAGGGSVVLPTHKVYPIKPSASNRILLRDGVTLNLADARLRVADDSPAYRSIVTAYGGESAALSRSGIRGGEIDQNPLGHAAANINLTDRGQWVVLMTGAVTDFNFSDIYVTTCGINALSISGDGCRRIRSNDCTYTFIQAYSDTPGYDNSAVYIEAIDIEVSGNRFYSEHAQKARGCLELHGPLSVAHGNRSWNYWTLANLVSSEAAIDTAVDAYLVSVSDNIAYGARRGITIWPRTGTTYRNIAIHDNQLYISQIDGNWTNFWGVGWDGNAGSDGTVDGLSIQGNMVSFQPGDSRATCVGGSAFDWSMIHGINIGSNSVVRNGHVRGNTILNAPLMGMKFGNLNFAGSDLQNIASEDNLIVDAGSNRAMHKDLRPSLCFFGKFTNTRIRRNTIIDTLSDGSGTDSRWLWVRYTATSGGGNLFEGNDVIGPSGHALSELTNESVFPMRRAASATMLGTVTGRQEVFDEYGASLGYVPIYDGIS